MRIIDLEFEHATLEQLTLAPGERVLITSNGVTVEARVKPSYRAQHFHLWIAGIFSRRFRNMHTVTLNWWPVRIDGRKVTHTIYVELDGTQSRESLEHEFQHVAQMARHGLIGYAWRYVRPRGRLQLEAEAKADKTRRLYRSLSYARFMAWLVDAADQMRGDYALGLITFNRISRHEVQAALLEAAGIPHDGGIPAARDEDELGR